MDEEMGVSLLLNESQETAENCKSEAYIGSYHALDKATVLQEARMFHDPTQVRRNTRQCCTVIAQLLYLQNTGRYLSRVEATKVFFGVTKLFANYDASLCRVVYLFIKDLAEICSPDDVIVVTSSLTKDMVCDFVLFRANALRVLVRSVGATLLGTIGPILKKAIVDVSGRISSSALVSASQLFTTNADCAAVVSGWISETTKAVSSPSEMVHFHAMQLLYQIHQHGRLSSSKLVTLFTQRATTNPSNAVRPPLALVLLVRYTAKLLADEVEAGRHTGSYQESTASPVKEGYALLEASLRHTSELVVYEAARAICHLPLVAPQDLHAAISTLQLFVSSPKPVTRYAAIQTLAVVANQHPRAVANGNDELDALTVI